MATSNMLKCCPWLDSSMFGAGAGARAFDLLNYMQINMRKRAAGLVKWFKFYLNWIMDLSLSFIFVFISSTFNVVAMMFGEQIEKKNDKK